MWFEKLEKVADKAPFGSAEEMLTALQIQNENRRLRRELSELTSDWNKFVDLYNELFASDKAEMAEELSRANDEVERLKLEMANRDAQAKLELEHEMARVKAEFAAEFAAEQDELTRAKADLDHILRAADRKVARAEADAARANERSGTALLIKAEEEIKRLKALNARLGGEAMDARAELFALRNGGSHV